MAKRKHPQSIAESNEQDARKKQRKSSRPQVRPTVDSSGLTKAQRKRHRQMERMREGKQSLPADEVSKLKKPSVDGKSQAPTQQTTKTPVIPSLQAADHQGGKKAVKQQQPKAPKTHIAKTPENNNDIKLSKRQRRRQKNSKLKSRTATTSKPDSETLQTTSGPIFKQEDLKDENADAAQADESLLRNTTLTTLLPRPRKQWIEIDPTDSPSGGVPPLSKKAANGPNNDVIKTTQTTSAEFPSPLPQPSNAHNNLSTSPERSDLNPSKAALARVGLSPVAQTPAARPGTKTIASFSLSSRRQPASVLSKGIRNTGLSGVRMDTSSIGSRPISSLKATSVPSSSVRGDAKLAFQRFEKFANGSAESDSDEESSDSDSDSDTGGVAVPVTSPIAAKTTGSPSGPRKLSGDVKGRGSDSDSDGGVETTKISATSHPSEIVDADDHAANSELEDGPISQGDNESNSDRVAATAVLPSGTSIDANPTPITNLNADNTDTAPAKTSLWKSTTFLGRELGGNSSGPGPNDDEVAAHRVFDEAFNFSSRFGTSDDEANEGREELYRSVDDISREVFGSTRPLPDSKPLSNRSDVAGSHFVTDPPSNHGLMKKLSEQTTPDKAIALGNIVRGASPVVMVANTAKLGVKVVPEGGDQASYEQEQGTATKDLANPPPTTSDGAVDEGDEYQDIIQVEATPSNKRKMTGTTSKHFSPQKQPPKTRSASAKVPSKTVKDSTAEDPDQHSSNDDSPESAKSKRSPKKNTGKTSTFFPCTTSPTKTPRPSKGTSICPVPPTTADKFGLIQEKLWDQPFWLIIAATFLNKTTGRSAAPVFWQLKEDFSTPEALSQAGLENLVGRVKSLGLYNQRAQRFIDIAKTWLGRPPAKGVRHRALHYPAQNDGKEIKKSVISAGDLDDCPGTLEIAHVPGTGPYAWDSWRIFCRDVLRGIAEDYNGKGAGEGFVPEWQRVLPLDKELRACLRWMWLREGWVWDCETGEKREATEEEKQMAARGEMKIGDVGEQKFAREAAGNVGGDSAQDEDAVDDDDEEQMEDAAEEKDAAVPVAKPKKKARKTSIARRELRVATPEADVANPEEEEQVGIAKRRTRSTSTMLQGRKVLDAADDGDSKPPRKRSRKA